MSKKLLQKLVSGFAAVAMAASMVGAVPVAAATTQLTDTYSITIHGSKNPTTGSNKATDATGHTYEAYQIFTGKVWVNNQDTEATGDDTYSMTDITFGDNVTWNTAVSSQVNGQSAATSQTLLAALQADSVIGSYFTSISAPADATDAAKAKLANDIVSAIQNNNVADNSAQADAFANILEQYLTGSAKGSAATPNADGDYVISSLQPGYYLVKDKDASLDKAKGKAYTKIVLRLVKSVEVTPKSDVPTVEKKVQENETTDWQDVADYQIGDYVPFKVTGTIASNYADYQTYKYVFHDTFSKGLTFVNKALDTDSADNETKNYGYKVTIDGHDVGSDKYTVSYSAPNLTITFNDLKTLKYDSDNDGEEDAALVSATSSVVVTYYAKLNSDAEIGTTTGNPNKVYLEYSNNPNHDGNGKTGNSEEDKVIVFTYKLNNYKGDEDKTALGGAKFVLLTSGTSKYAIFVDGKVAGWESAASIEDDDKYTESSYTVPDGYKEGATAIMTSAADTGLFSATGLDATDYVLREVVQPNGYNKITTDLPVSITRTIVETTKNNWVDEATTKLITGLMIDTTSSDTYKPNETLSASVTTTGENAGDGTVSDRIVNTPASPLPSTGGAGRFIYMGFGAAGLAAVIALLAIKKRRAA